MLTTSQLIITIAVIALGTLLTRALPFLLFRGDKKTPEIIDYLGKVLPFAIIGMLVVYCLKSVSVNNSPYGLPELLAILFIIIVHKFKKNMLLSIGGGTAVYMLLVNLVFK